MNTLPLYAFLSAVPTLALVLGLVAVALALGFFGVPLWAWTLAFAIALYGLGAPAWLWIVFALVAVVLNVIPVRRALVTSPLMGFMRKSGFLPVISETEQVAIEAGTVWVESELFSGKPDFKRLLSQPYPDLTPEEQAFLDGPAEKVCRMTDDWEVTVRRDLPPEVWDYLKQERFFGMIIPVEYGGLGFSPLANSAVVQKLATRSIPLSITVMVPNSLGPAELLLHYGTPEQRDYYLPRLALGEEIPAFALTEPGAGSDAGAISASGVVLRGEDGRLYLRLNWRKRYITLAAASTLLGLAFKLSDPDRLLGRETDDLGITCALIPTDTPGVLLGRRHDPMGIPFINSPTEGQDVVVPVDAIIGGAAGAGIGWRMLMESLAAGRGISLPAQAAGGSKHVARVASGHAAVRRQFGLPIGRFEGIEEPLARITGFTYVLEAARKYTCGGIATGAKPAVVTALLKYLSTELQRQVINDGMDILAGNAISRGPRNLLASGYTALPISITVEGANILTRTLMVFGQGAIRCHPYVYREIRALAEGDARTFDDAFCRHVGHVVRNKCRSLVLTLTRGWAAAVPGGPLRRYYRRMAWASASFAFMADLAMATLGGNLKRKEKITGRFADILAWMYVGATVLRRFEAEGRRKEDLPLVHWSMQYAFARMQAAFDGLHENFHVFGLTWFFRGPLAFWSRLNPIGVMPSDSLGGKLARIIQTPGPQRDRITAGIDLPADLNEALGRLEHAFVLAHRSEDVARAIKTAVRSGRLPEAGPDQLIESAVAAGVVSAQDAALLREAEAAREAYVEVDSFPTESYLRHFMGDAYPENVVDVEETAGQ